MVLLTCSIASTLWAIAVGILFSQDHSNRFETELIFPSSSVKVFPSTIIDDIWLVLGVKVAV